jgi:hypothetical protein
MDEEFDPQAFISGADTTTATEPPTEQPKELPTVTPNLTTFYYPSTPEDTKAKGLSYSMEGGTQGGGKFGDIDLRNHTLEQFLAGNSPFVAVARKGAPTGEEFKMNIGNTPIVGKWVDTGGGLRDGQTDIATSNPDLAKTGIQHGFDPQAFINGKPQPIVQAGVPDIHAFMEPAPPEPEAAPTPDEPSTAETVGGAIGKGISKFGAAIANQPIPKFSAMSPFPQQLIPQVPAPQQQVIPSQGMIGQSIPSPTMPPQPSPAPMPTPALSLMPDDGRPIPGEFMRNLKILASDTGKELKDMVNAPVELSKTALNPNVSAPRRLAAAAGVIASAAQLDPLLPHGAVRTREVPVPEAFQPKIAKAIDSYDFDEGHSGNAQLANDLSKIDKLPKPVEDALQEFRDAQKVDREQYGERSGLPEQYGDKLQQVARQHAGNLKAPKSQKVSQSTTVDVSKILGSKTQSEFTSEIGSAMMKAKNQADIEAIKVAHDSWKSAPPLGQPPQGPPPQNPPPAAPKPSYSKSVNPAADHGPFTKTYKIDKELGEMMDALGAAPETGALIAETQSRNMLHELTPQQEADLGNLLVSDRLRTVNPEHPQIMMDSMARGIESVPAIKKALDYYKKEIKPQIEAIRKRAGLSEEAAAGKSEQFISLVPERNPDGSIPEFVPRGSTMSGTTSFAKAAQGNAAKYSTDLREILRQSYTEAIRKAAYRELKDAAHGKGVAKSSPQFVPDPENGPNAGKWISRVRYEDLPGGMQHDINLINAGKSTVRPEGIQKVLQGYQRGATAVQLGLNPLEIQNHMRRQLAILATKPPIGQGLMARLEAVVPFFGPKIGALKRAMSDMSTPARQQILEDITRQGGGSSRAFREKYGTKIPGLKQVSEFTNKLLFGYPSGKGVMGFDLRMRVLLEEIRRNAEPALAKDKQRMRVFSNQMGQYGTMASWPVRALRHVNPYAATTLPMRWAELRTLFGGSGLKSSSVPQALMRRAETFMRGTGGTIAMLTIANKLLSGNYPWQNKAGKEFDLKTGVKDKNGDDIYVPNRFLSPELFRAISTMSIPPLLAERGAPNRSALSETAAATLGPINAGMSLVNSPALGIAAAAGPQWALHAEKFPGQKSLDIMKVGQYTKKDEARGVPPLLKRAEGVAEQVHPLLASILGYMDEPIKGLKPLGVISVDKERHSSGYSRDKSSGRGSGGRGSGRGQGGR